MRKWKNWFSLFLLINCFNVSFSQNYELEKVLRKFVQMEVDFAKNPAVLVGVIEGDSAYVYDFGTIDKTKEQLPTANTLFEIGSITKVFTASILEILIRQEQLKWEDSLSNFFPKEQLHTSLGSITVLELVTHTSGLPRLPFNFGEKEKEKNNPYAYYTDTDLFAFLNKYPLTNEKKYLYSHLNYVLLELIIEQTTQQPLPDLIQQRILTPLQMTQTYFTLPDSLTIPLAQGYLLTGEKAPLWTFQTFKGAVGMKSTLNDLLKFIQSNLYPPHSELTQTFAKMHDIKRPANMKRVKIGVGWHLVKPKKRYYTIISHSGSTAGHQCYIGFIKETQTAIITLSNSKNSLDNLGGYLLKMVNNNWKRKSLTEF